MYSLIYIFFQNNNIDPTSPYNIMHCRQLTSHHPQIAAAQSEALHKTSSNSNHGYYISQWSSSRAFCIINCFHHWQQKLCILLPAIAEKQRSWPLGTGSTAFDAKLESTLRQVNKHAWSNLFTIDACSSNLTVYCDFIFSHAHKQFSHTKPFSQCISVH